SPSEQAELDFWLAANPGNRALLSDYCTLSARLDRIVPELAAAGSIAMPPPRPRRAWGAWGALAGAAAIAAIAVGVAVHRGSGQPDRLSTPAGKRGAFTLSDGSRIELNANTTVIVENGRSERRVRLANGEAFFVVSKDKTRPFIVETPAGSVRVTGTIFNVLTEAASQLDVTVVEGSVQVRLDSAAPGSASSADLVAGGVLQSEGGAVTVGTKSEADIGDALAWRRGVIVCSAMPISDALARFGHYHGIAMTATAGAAARRVGGQYSLGNLDEFLDYLKSLDLRVDRRPDGSILVSLPGGG
ncbi:MAG TPA: FecR domain-containing protein, partial [Opitutaceae bacterium]